MGVSYFYFKSYLFLTLMASSLVIPDYCNAEEKIWGVYGPSTKAIYLGDCTSIKNMASKNCIERFSKIGSNTCSDAMMPSTTSEFAHTTIPLMFVFSPRRIIGFLPFINRVISVDTIYKFRKNDRYYVLNVKKNGIHVEDYYEKVRSKNSIVAHAQLTLIKTCMPNSEDCTSSNHLVGTECDVGVVFREKVDNISESALSFIKS